MSLSLIIPAYNEEKVIENTLIALMSEFQEMPDLEALVIDDFSQDQTAKRVRYMAQKDPRIKLIKNQTKKGFAGAITSGIENASKEYLAIVMGDGSESPRDVKAFYAKAKEGFDCVFGSRFQGEGKTTNYPRLKLFINRSYNKVLKTLFAIEYDDFSNAFKLYKTNVAKQMLPLRGRSFSISPELCLKCIIAGKRYYVLPNSWRERDAGRSKFAISKEFFFYNSVLLRMLFLKIKGAYL